MGIRIHPSPSSQLLPPSQHPHIGKGLSQNEQTEQLKQEKNGWMGCPGLCHHRLTSRLIVLTETSLARMTSPFPPYPFPFAPFPPIRSQPLVLASCLPRVLLHRRSSWLVLTAFRFARNVKMGSDRFAWKKNNNKKNTTRTATVVKKIDQFISPTPPE